jgi:hypothetical protein
MGACRIALIIDGMARLAVAIHQERVDALRGDAAIGVGIGAAEDFAEGYLAITRQAGLRPITVSSSSSNGPLKPTRLQSSTPATVSCRLDATSADQY